MQLVLLHCIDVFLFVDFIFSKQFTLTFSSSEVAGSFNNFYYSTEMLGKKNSQKNKIDKNEATYGLAFLDISHNTKAKGDMDCFTGMRQKDDRGKSQELKLQQNLEEEIDSTDQQTKLKRLMFNDDWAGKVKLPSLHVFKSDSQEQTKVQPQHTSRTDAEGKLVQSIKCGRFTTEIGTI